MLLGITSYYPLWFVIMIISNLLPTTLAAHNDDQAINTSCTKEHFCALQPALAKRYLIFVSFSMPEVALKSLYAQANNNGGVLLLRGLKKGSFKATAAYIKSLGIGVQIDPTAFKKYQIERVPTIVLVDEPKFYAISGNISLQYAKEKLLEAAR